MFEVIWREAESPRAVSEGRFGILEVVAVFSPHEHVVIAWSLRCTQPAPSHSEYTDQWTSGFPFTVANT